MAIPKRAIQAFRLLAEAHNLGVLALVEVIRKSDGKPTTVVCCITPGPDGGGDFLPIAELIIDDPDELFVPPGGCETVEDEVQPGVN